MDSYRSKSDLNISKLGEQEPLFSKISPQKGKSVSERCLYQNLEIVGSGASLAEQTIVSSRLSLANLPISVSSDDLYFIGFDCPDFDEETSPKNSGCLEQHCKLDDHNVPMNSPKRVSENSFLSLKVDEEFSKKASFEGEASLTTNRFKTISQSQYKSPKASNKMARTTCSQSPSNGLESAFNHNGKHKKHSNSPLSKISLEKSFPHRKKEKKVNLLSLIPFSLSLVHDITTTLTQTFIKISFVDQDTKQTLLIRIRCRNSKEKISEEDLLGLILIDEIHIKTKLLLNKDNLTVTAYSDRLREMHITMIYPASEQDISEHKKGFMIEIESKPSDEYTQYRRQQNEIDLATSWIGKVLCRDPIEQKNFISEIGLNNGDGSIILVSPLSSKQHRIICVVDYLSETICSLRDLETRHVSFLEKMRESIVGEIQNNEKLISYRDCPIYIEIEYPSKVHCLHFNISLNKNKNNFELSEIIARLRENTNYWKEIVLKVSLSSQDPRVALYKDATNVLTD